MANSTAWRRGCKTMRIDASTARSWSSRAFPSYATGSDRSPRYKQTITRRHNERSIFSTTRYIQYLWTRLLDDGPNIVFILCHRTDPLCRAALSIIYRTCVRYKQNMSKVRKYVLIIADLALTHPSILKEKKWGPLCSVEPNELPRRVQSATRLKNRLINN